MNGPHDMGGMQCYGPVIPEEDEPLFHGCWEKKAMAITVGMGFTGMWNLDMGRFHRESLPPEQYLSSSYYEIWLSALQNLMVEKGLVTASELETGKIEFEGLATKKPVPNAEQVLVALSKGAPVIREVAHSAKFKLGEKVLTSTASQRGTQDYRVMRVGKWEKLSRLMALMYSQIAMQQAWVKTRNIFTRWRLQRLICLAKVSMK